MIKEIGSEFHYVEMEKGEGITFPRSGTLTFCGRTALEIVLNEIPHAKTAFLPSYCCDSMIEPFRRAGILVKFYDVNYEKTLQIDVPKDGADLLLWCDYFGFKNELPKFNGIIIEDITHSLLSENSYHSRSDFLIASIRKWEPIYSGGYCSVKTTLVLPSQEFVNDKAEAMKLKSQYLLDLDERKKLTYLSTFSNSNKWLADNYSKLDIDSYSKDYIKNVNVALQREKRRKNANVLYDGLKDAVEFMFDKKYMDCPLFVPIILKEKRDEIRKYLVDNKIYCPVHWPRPNADCKSIIYDIELSLVCDQRYDEKDMERIVSVLKNKLLTRE